MFTVRITSRKRIFEAQAGIENVMGRPAVESIAEAEIAGARNSEDLSDWDSRLHGAIINRTGLSCDKMPCNP
jgi:hypothetical protein